MTAFIGYRHVDPDQGLADELHQSLVARGTRSHRQAHLDRDGMGEGDPGGDRQGPVLRGAALGRVHLERHAVRDGSCGDERDFQRLHAAGLVTGPSRTEARMRCSLYARYL
ncbi:MAG: hypothetical protein ACREXX_15795 [Gammaproteobacteria bacterium]